MLICQIKSLATLIVQRAYCHPQKIVAMWHSAERFAPWCFTLIYGYIFFAAEQS